VVAGVGLDGQKVAAARLSATHRLPYLATALFASSILSSPGSGTIGIDRQWQVRADPAVVDGMTVEELARLLVHLTGHVLRDHAARAGRAGVDEAAGSAARWNRCADAEINDDLVGDGVVPSSARDLPGDIGCDDGGVVEDYFVQAGEGSRRWDCGSGADGLPRPGETADGVAPGQAEMLRWSTAAEIQRSHGRHPGSVAGGWLRWAEAVLPSRTDWRRALAAEIRSGVAPAAGNVDYTYRRPSRRSGAASGVVLPSLRRPVPDVAIVCDTSGSMHDQLLARALTEIEGILRRVGLRQAQVRVLAVDTAVHAVRRVSSAAGVRLAGGGGTDMGRGISTAADLRPRPSIIVVLTDGYTPWPSQGPPGIRVVVGLLLEGHGRPPAPPAWARTVEIDAGAPPAEG
jgi:predicted metal-dependent peptidase